MTHLTLSQFAKHRLEKATHTGCLRELSATIRTEGSNLEHNGKHYISFACNDYLGLSHHPEMIKAAANAITAYGTGGGASQLVTGHHPLYDELATHISSYKKSESACIFGSGYLANIGAITALAGKSDLIITDRLAHACILDGAKLSGATLKRFAHNNLEHLENLLQEHRPNFRHCLIITETVFSMDGDLAPLAAIRNLADQYDAWMMTDDAHGFGVLPAKSTVYADIQMGTFSKAGGSYGGYVCADKDVISMLTNDARTLIYTTALPPSVLAANLTAVTLISNSNHPSTPLQKARHFTSLMSLDEAQSAIVPIIIGDEDKTLSIAAQLKEAGFLVGAIRPPTVPLGTSRLRLTFSSAHTHEDIERLSDHLYSFNLTSLQEVR